MNQKKFVEKCGLLVFFLVYPDYMCSTVSKNEQPKMMTAHP